MPYMHSLCLICMNAGALASQNEKPAPYMHALCLICMNTGALASQNEKPAPAPQA